MATYQKDITKNLTPANDGTAALASTIRSTGQLSAEAIKMSGKATAETIAAVGGTIWEAYKGKQEAQLEVDLDKQVADLQADVSFVKNADQVAKIKFEQDRSSFGAMAEEVRAASILAGADPEEARTLSTGFYQEKENKLLSSFREEQQRITAARDLLPGRQMEMMGRSETLLKKAIANMPGMANNFRKIAQEVTGKDRLDLYSVNRLYEDVSFIEKQKEERAKQQAALLKQSQDAYVADRTKGGVGQVQALAEFNMLSSGEQQQLAASSVAAVTNKEAAKAALDKGGQEIRNVVTLSIAGFQNDLLTSNTNIYAQMQKLGVSRTQIATGTIPDTILSSPEYRKLVEEAGTKTLFLLDAQYKQLNESIQAKIKTTPADAAMLNQASADAKMWYEASVKQYTESKTTFLQVLSDGDFTKTGQQRLTFVETIVKGLGLNPEVIASLGMSGNEVAYKEAQVKYPKEAAILKYADVLRRAALMGVGQEEWQRLVKEIDKYRAGDTTVPATPAAQAASVMDHAQLAYKLREQVLTNTYGPNVSLDVSKVVLSATRDPASAERFLKQSTTAVTTAMSKIPAGERTAFVTNVTQGVNDSLYGFGGHADAAKTRLNDYNASYKGAGAVTTLFADETGNKPLKMVATRDTTPATFATTGGGAATGMPQPTTKAPQPTAINNVLSGVDDVLRIQSLVTNQPIEKLRADFIKTFNQEGMPSAAFTKVITDAARSVDPTAGEAKDKAAQEAADAIDPGATTKTINATSGNAILDSLSNLKAD